MHLKKKEKSKIEIDKFKETTKLQKPEKKDKNALTFQNKISVIERRQKVLNGFESKIFPTGKQTQGK